MFSLGRGRGALKDIFSESLSLPSGSDTFHQSSTDALLEIRITEIIDVTTFWAQIGTAKQFEDFDQYCVSLSAQCEDNVSSMQDSPVVVGRIVPARDGSNPCGNWQRAKIARILPNRTVEVYFVDTGKVGRLPLSDICSGVPPLTMEMSTQALQCNLYGVEMKESLREEGVARLQELVSNSHLCGMKTIIHSVCSDMFFLCAYTLFEGHWTSVGEILRMEGLVEYESIPPGPLMVDHLVDESLPTHEDTTPPGYKSDSSALLDMEVVTRSLLQFDTEIEGKSHSSVASAAVSPAQDEQPSLKETNSIWLTPPPDDKIESGHEQETSASEGHLFSLLDPCEVYPSHVSVQPITPTDTPPDETGLDFDLSPPPLVPSHKFSSKKSTTRNYKEENSKLSKLTIPCLSLGTTSPKAEKILSPEPELQNSEPLDDVLPTREENASPEVRAEELETSSPVLSVVGSSKSEGSEHKEVVPHPPSENVRDSGKAGSPERHSSEHSGLREQVSSDPLLPSGESDNRKQQSWIEQSSSVGQERLGTVERENSLGSDCSKQCTSRAASPPHPEESGKPSEAEQSLPQVQANPVKKTSNTSESNTSDSEDEWDESLLPPRSSETDSKGGTPANTPEKNTQTRKEWSGTRKNRGRVKAQFDSLMGHQENWESANKGRGERGNWTRSKKFNKKIRNNNLGTLYSQQFWPRDQMFDTPRPPPSGGQLLLDRTPSAGRGVVREGRWIRYRDKVNPINTQPLPVSRDLSEQLLSCPENPLPRKGSPNPKPPQQFLSTRAEWGQFEPVPGVRDNLESTLLEPPRAENKKLEPPSQFFTEVPNQNATPRILGSGSQLSAEAEENEYQWHTWRIQNKIKKMISELSDENVKEFGEQVQGVLCDHSAQVLERLQREKTPLNVIMECILSRVTEEKKDELIVESIAGAVNSVSSPMLYKTLQDAVCVTAEEVSMGSADSSAQRQRTKFCTFVRKLFISASFSGNEEYSKCVGQSVNRCLDNWIGYSAQASHREQLACVECFVALCSDIGPTLDASSKESLDKYFTGCVREVILSNGHSRDVKEQLLDLVVKRATNWNGAKPYPPPRKASGEESVGLKSPRSIVEDSRPPSFTSTPYHMASTPMSSTPIQSPLQSIHSNSLIKPSDFRLQPSTPQAPPVQPLPGGLAPLSDVTHPPSSSYPLQTFDASQYGYGPVKSPTPADEMQGQLASGHGHHQPIQVQQSALYSPNATRPSFPLQGPSDGVAWSNGVSDQPRSISLHELSSNSGFVAPYFHRQHCGSSPQQQAVLTQQDSDISADPYEKTLEMLETLGFPELLPNFKQHMLMDFVLDSEMSTIKECLTNAKIPLGAVVGIMSYLENKRKEKHAKRRPVVSRPSSSQGYAPPPPAMGHGSQAPPLQPYHSDAWQHASPFNPPQQLPPSPLPQFVSPKPQSFMQANYKSDPRPLVSSPPASEGTAIKLPFLEESVKATAQVPRAAARKESAASGVSDVTVRLPKAHTEWNRSKSAQEAAQNGKDGSPPKEAEQKKGGFGSFSCLLCRSSTHTTMACKHRDRFFVHM